MCGMKTFGAGGNAEELKVTPDCIVDGDKGYATGFNQHKGVTVIPGTPAPAAFVGPTPGRMRPMVCHRCDHMSLGFAGLQMASRCRRSPQLYPDPEGKQVLRLKYSKDLEIGDSNASSKSLPCELVLRHEG